MGLSELNRSVGGSAVEGHTADALQEDSEDDEDQGTFNEGEQYSQSTNLSHANAAFFPEPLCDPACVVVKYFVRSAACDAVTRGLRVEGWTSTSGINAEAIIFLHGFNSSMSDALKRVAQVIL